MFGVWLFVHSQSLKVECCKLRAHVIEVQQQNNDLRRLFCDRARSQLNGDDLIAIRNLPVSLPILLCTRGILCLADLENIFKIWHLNFYCVNLRYLCLSALTLLVGWQEDHPACKKTSGGVLAWLSVRSEMQTCIWPS